MNDENVYLFVPNIIGYIRIVLLLLSFYYMSFDPFKTAFCYALSAGLDAIDGIAARHYQQSTKFGALLDMLTDRCATTGLGVILAIFFPSWALFFQLAIIIDISSHWIHCQSSYMKGSTSHKLIDLSGNPILAHYYNNRTILFLMCLGNEAFYAFLYLYHFTCGPIINLGLTSFGLLSFLTVVTFPVAVVKIGINLVQLAAACQNVVSIDVAERRKLKWLKD